MLLKNFNSIIIHGLVCLFLFIAVAKPKKVIIFYLEMLPTSHNNCPPATNFTCHINCPICYQPLAITLYTPTVQLLSICHTTPLAQPLAQLPTCSTTTPSVCSTTCSTTHLLNHNSLRLLNSFAQLLHLLNYFLSQMLPFSTASFPNFSTHRHC
jgi:hypothetical protein